MDVSKEVQVILTTHSPILVKQIMYNDFVKSIVINKDKSISTISDFKLPYLSSNEINYIAFGMATEEYHNELYEELNRKNSITYNLKKFDNDYFINIKGEQKNYPWKGNQNEISLHTFVRNQIHHRADNGQATYNNLKQSIEFMRSCL